MACAAFLTMLQAKGDYIVNECANHTLEKQWGTSIQHPVVEAF